MDAVATQGLYPPPSSQLIARAVSPIFNNDSSHHLVYRGSSSHPTKHPIARDELGQSI